MERKIFNKIAILAVVTLAMMGGDAIAKGNLIIGYKMKKDTLPKAWGVDLLQASNNYSANKSMRVKLIKTNIPANILWPEDQAELVFQFENLTDKPVTLKGFFDIERYRAYDSTAGTASQVLGLTGIEKLAEVQQIPINLTLPPKGFENVTIKPKIPGIFGGYVILVDIKGQGRFFGAGLSRVRKNVFPHTLYRRFTMDAHSIDQMTRLATYPNRQGINWKTMADADFEEWYAKDERIGNLRKFKKAGMTTTVEFGVSAMGFRVQPMGMRRNHLDEFGVMKNGKGDMVWEPKYDKEFGDFVYRLCCDYGYPKGAINGVMLWNEPWEGLSIAGWGADMTRYREIYKVMAEAVVRARKDAGVDVLIGGCDSSSNTFDKLLPDGEEWMKWLDFMSIHYQGNSPAATVKVLRNRTLHKGRVLIWDTESWAANTDDGVAGMAAGCYSFGYDRIVGIKGSATLNLLNATVRNSDGTKHDVIVPHAWAINATIAASQSFVGERPFRELLFRNGLPWTMVFDGQKDPDDGAIVVVGDLPFIFRRGTLRFPYRGVRSLAELRHEQELRKQLAALPKDAVDERQQIQAAIDAYEMIRDGKMTLSDGNGMFHLYDSYGNRIPAKNGKLEIELGIEGAYLRTDGSPGSFAKLIEAARSARIEGLEPLDIICHDMLVPISEKPELKLELTNILNRPVTGKLSVTLGNLTVKAPEILSFTAHETKMVPVKVISGKPSPNNTYPLTISFDADRDGQALHEEEMHVNRIGRRTIKVDGKLDDWKGALVQPIRPAGAPAATLEELAWLPFQKMPEAVTGGFATTWLAYDDTHFYFAARIADTSQHEGLVRFETRNDSEYYYPETVIELDKKRTLMMKESVRPAAPGDKQFLLHPDRANERVNGLWQYKQPSVAFAIDLNIPPGKAQKISLFIPPWNCESWAKMKLEVIDLGTGKTVGKSRVSAYRKYNGQYLTFNAEGHIRLRISAREWHRVGVAGIFFDPVAAGQRMGKIMPVDEGTGGNWKRKYGRNGYLIIGASTKLPKGITVATPNIINKKEHTWPEGVRRYSYRKHPSLPGGGGDSVQIAFNAIPAGAPEAGIWESLPFPKGTRWHYTDYSCTDYEYALNPVAPKYGGGTEIWRLQYPNMPRKHFYPRQPKHRLEGPVKTGQLVITHEGNTRIVECAIPWSEIPHVKALYDAGKPVKFSCRINDNAAGRRAPMMELANERSVSKINNSAFRPNWNEHWANEVEFSFGK